MSTTIAPRPDEVSDEETEGGGSRKKKLLIIGLILALVGGAAWFFLLKPDSAEAAPEAGEVVSLEPIQVNLSGGHYLRIGVALQLTAEVAHEVDGSKALDATIEVFSGREMEELVQPKQRDQLKEELGVELEELYHGDVMGVYFTEFVTQ